MFAVAPRVLIANKASRTHTVIEVNGRDRPGLLYDVTRALIDLGLQISSAMVFTYGERAVDVFYVKDVFGFQVTHEGKLERVRQALTAALEGVEPARPAPGCRPRAVPNPPCAQGEERRSARPPAAAARSRRPAARPGSARSRAVGGAPRRLPAAPIFQ